MEKIEHCYCCQHTDFNSYLDVIDNYSKEKFSIQQCKNCHFVFTNPRPDSREIGKYYTAPDYLSHQSHTKGLIQSIYRYARNYMKSKKLQLIQKAMGKENEFSLLDYGCGTGDFLSYVQQNKINAFGVEPDAHARTVAKRINQVETYSVEQSSTIENGKFDVITLWHVLEHIHDLHQQIGQFNAWLKPKGKLVIAVPNIESYDAQYYGKFWDALDVPRHIYHFSPACIAKIMEQHQFKLTNTHPLFLDAYYISMRSEWHKGTSKFWAYFKAIWRGFLSNQSAKKSGNYSSLIYIFEKQ
ncbi:MAG: class I SAM-dependent methyltransferase [Chitinophagales bacterium]